MATRKRPNRKVRSKRRSGPQSDPDVRRLGLVRIGATEIEIVESPHAGTDVFGLYVGYPKPQVMIVPGLTRQQRGQTILHELLHACDDIYGLGLSESKVRVLEQAIWCILTDMPTLRPRRRGGTQQSSG